MASQDLEVDEYASDSAYTGNDDSIYTSIASSIRSYRHEHGRTYHAFKDGAYFMPNDEKENDRLDMQHAMFVKTIDGKLQLAPIGEVHNVLDIGTGTGIWAVDFADQHPSAQVTGTDLSPIQPQFVPLNLTFLVDDAEDEWVFDNKFDFIHARMMCGSFADWPKFIQRTFDWLEPGGYVEIQDIGMPFKSDDDTLNPDTALWKWSDMLIRSGEVIGRPLNHCGHLTKWMEDAGFVDVVEVVKKWPQNPWAKDPEMKELGLWNMANMLEGIHGLSMRPFVGALGMTPDEVEVFLTDVRKDVKNPRIHSYWVMYYVYGRRPA
ncbi:S-adenosyl-L-methionine-dependent methyltransferase [Eremomyces bilateralis CBS 781.70]|uniref:S-adenosyl-L-methionine-dependent methyltransferase n=1 Tax=Eremomyces bilateralis CBS 781.70 TaxID=1392243 RepID=A0A6G1GBP7_9PEZI|nr:S-adenosyl-L-methionine-dependent methyltransferase [Eremomyces bilateralis CBS 781.70]KAF1815269.1 S-adenosyl-L-methionine-dependent methyltransferase [Eremomyces bilateralis CBS 781.70]